MERLRKVEEDRINQLKLLEHQKMEDELERQIEETRKANMQLRIQQELKRLQEQVVFAISRHFPYISTCFDLKLRPSECVYRFLNLKHAPLKAA